MKKHPKHMKMSELCARAQKPAATIRYYARQGLLPTPVKTSKTMAYYTIEHLERLQQIDALKKKGHSLDEISTIVSRDSGQDYSTPKPETIYSSKRDVIITAAIELFRERGFDKTGIDDIVTWAGIGKGTFYQHFNGKEDLFNECGEHVFYDIARDEPDISEEIDGIKRLWKRSCSFAHSHLHMIDMINVARGVSVSRKSRVEQTFDKIMENLISPLETDLLMATRQGQIHFKDVRWLAYFLMGSNEYCSYYSQNHPDKDVDHNLAKAWDMILNGLSYGQGPSGTGETKAGGNLFNVSEPSKKSGISTSTTSSYIHEGHLPAAVKTEKTQACSTDTRLKVLERIGHKQKAVGKSPSAIRKEIGKDAPISGEGGNNTELLPAGKRDSILSCSTKLFLEKGYAETSIADIAQQGRISKETIYQHFRNKEEIFMACADRIFFHMYDEVWNGIKGEKDMYMRIIKRGKAFFYSYRRWRSMMNLVKGLSVGDNPTFKAKFHQIIEQMTKPMMREFEILIQEGRFRKDIDSELAAFLLLGMSEYAAILILQEHCNAEEMLSCILGIIDKGIR